MALVPPNPPAPTPEYASLEPRADENPFDALARVGDEIVSEMAGAGIEPKDGRKNKKFPKQIGALIALRAQGYDVAEIAEKLGVGKQRVYQLIRKARKDFGWSDLGDKIAHTAVPQAVENVIKHLEYEGSAPGVALGRSVMTRKTLEGVGVFKSHSAVKQESKSEVSNTLRVEFVLPQLPPGVQVPALADGSVLATPRRALASEEPVAALGAPEQKVVDGEVVKA